MKEALHQLQTILHLLALIAVRVDQIRQFIRISFQIKKVRAAWCECISTDRK